MNIENFETYLRQGKYGGEYDCGLPLCRKGILFPT